MEAHDDLTEPHLASAGTLTAALRRRDVSSVDLVDAAIARIDALDDAINAVVVRDFDRAREAARAADEALASGAPGKLLGLPMTVKEAHNVKGLATTWGMPPFKDWIAPADSVAVGRLKAAGAIILGKTNVPPFLADWQSANPIHGRTVNPWDPTRTPGGSSGGSAAALAAGFVALELGSDLAGSIRIPAAFCGVLGHKPSYGLIPTRGAAPPGVDGATIPLAVTGPMARSAADLELALDVLAGPMEDDATGYRLTLPPARHSRLDDFRVLIVDTHPAARLDAEIQEAIDRLGAWLDLAGVTVTRGGEPLGEPLPDLEALLECFGSMLDVITSRGEAPASEPVSAHAWMSLLDTQLSFRRRWAALFSSFDVVLAPAFGTVAFRHVDNPDMSARTLSINGEESPYGVQGAWSSMASLANLPATAAPIDRSPAGLPIGVQIIGPYLEDRTTIEFARLLERERGELGIAPKYPPTEVSARSACLCGCWPRRRRAGVAFSTPSGANTGQRPHSHARREAACGPGSALHLVDVSTYAFLGAP